MNTSHIKKSVLMVGDSFFIPLQLAGILQKHGYNVTSIGSESSELTSGMRLNPEIVLVDFEMQHNNPYDIISSVHRLLPRSQIIMMNGRMHHCNSKKAKTAGALKILNRRFDLSDLGFLPQ